MMRSANLIALALWLVGWQEGQCETWQGGWGHPPTSLNTAQPLSPLDGRTPARLVYAPLPAVQDVTIRQIVRVSAAARVVRVRFTNEFGTKPLRIGAAHIAFSQGEDKILPGSDHILRFAGKLSVDIPPGAPMLSDPLPWDLPALSKISVSIYYPDETVPPAHTLFALEAWQSAGDQSGATTLRDPLRARSGLHVAEVDILAERGGSTLVTFGDSITEGVASTGGAFRSWPDRLSERLQADPQYRGWSVVNAGMGSNRLLHDTPSNNALSRFDRDVLSVPGTKAVIILLGINDIQYSHRNPQEAVRAFEVIAALRQLIARAHAANIKIFGATLTPFEGSSDYTPDGEADRQAINGFIRSGAFDKVVDFDAILRDPNYPNRLRADFDSGGHLHPNDNGYRAMGDSIDLGMF